jgi:hypothetical protein
MKRTGAIAVLVLVAGCATQSALTPIKYEYADVPAERRIEVSYRNITEVTMCLLPEHWPNQAGKINQASDSVFLVVGQERFPIEKFNTGYCPQGCATRVAPGDRVCSSIPYEDFGLPERLKDAPKILEFSPMAFACKSK